MPGARNVTALLGPAVCGACYEVPDAMQAEVARVAPAAAVRTRTGTPGLDLRAGLDERLRAAGVPEVVHDPRCTVEDPHAVLPPPRRRHRPAGRAGLARLTDPARVSRLEREPAGRAGPHRRRGPGGRPRPVDGRPARREQDLAGRRRRAPSPRSGSATSARTGSRNCSRRRRASSPTSPLRWHFIGQLQRNKAAAVARLGAVVHSVDRLAAGRRSLDRAGQEGGRPVEVLAAGRPRRRARGLAARGGADPAERPGLADAVASRAGSAAARPDGRGAPRRGSGAGLRPAGRRWPRACAPTIPDAVELSAGMSGDLEAAVAAGATVVRVGTALFGDRPLPSGEIEITSHASHTSHTGHPGAPCVTMHGTMTADRHGR